MLQGHCTKRTYVILAGLALVALLVFYGVTGQGEPNFKPATSQLQNGNQEQLVVFGTDNNHHPREDSIARFATLMKTSRKASSTRHGKKRVSLKDINSQVPLQLKEGVETHIKGEDSTISSEDEYDSTTTTSTESTSTDFPYDLTTLQTTPKKSKINNGISPFKSTNTKVNLKKESKFDMLSTFKTTKVRDQVNKAQASIKIKLAEGNETNRAESATANKTKVTNFTEIENRFSARIQRYTRFCSKPEYRRIKPTKYIKSVRSYFANDRLRWCQIPKIATTFLKYVRRENANEVKRQGLARYSRSEQKSFFLVREPYSRLVSGFICKILTNPMFWRRYGLNIVSKYRPHASDESKRCGHDVTFPEFVKYFIKAQKSGLNKNKHFTPIHEQCSICRDDYDYIVHLETLIPDMSYIFDSVGVKIAVDIRNTEKEIISKSMSMMSTSNRRKNCYFQCQNLRTLWWSFQARGFISTESEFPFGYEDCKTASVDTFTKLAVNAYKQFTDKEKRSKQKRDMMSKLYIQVPLEDRLKLQNIFLKDFQLFEYDSQPRDVFPEMFNEK